MAGNIEISGQERLTLRRVIDRAPESQKAIAKQCALTEPWLSQLLPPKETGDSASSAEPIEPRTVRNDQFERLVRLLAYKIRAGQISIPEAVQQEFQQIERRIGVAASRPVYRSRPGDPVTAGSSLYVERDGWDDQIKAEMAHAPDIRICLHGPPGTGKQSALAWMIRDLKESGIKVAQFSGGMAIHPADRLSEARIFTAIAQVARRDWKVDLPLPANRCIDEVGELAEWLSQASATAGPSVLVCDQLEKLDPEQRDPQLYIAAVQCARALARVRSQNGETPGLIYCSEFQRAVDYPELMAISSGGCLTFIESRLMTESQILTFLIRANDLNAEGRLPEKELHQVGKMLFSAFEGHPEFTHRAFDRMGSNNRPRIPSLKLSDGIVGCERFFKSLLAETPALPTFTALMGVVKASERLALSDQARFLEANGLLRKAETPKDAAERRFEIHSDSEKNHLVKTHIYKWLVEINSNL